MILQLILLMTLVPIFELIMLFRVHDFLSEIYGSDTAVLISIGTILITGIAGAKLAKSQGVQVIKKMKENAGNGQLPADSIMDGVMILVGGGLLLTPGYLTDFFGLSLIIPLSRVFWRKILKSWVQKQMQSGKFVMHGNFGSQGQSGFHYSTFQQRDMGFQQNMTKKYPDAIDVEARDLDS